MAHWVVKNAKRVSGSKLKRWYLGTMKKLYQKVKKLGASLVGQWLRFHTINAGVRFSP